MAALRLDHVEKRYGETVALDDLSLDVADGELLVIVGPSGCGKTTALRVAAGLEAPTAGRVRIGERDVTRDEPGRRNVAMVFQSHALFPHLTVARNIGFGLEARKVEREEIARRVAAAAEVVGCGGVLERRPDQLSGGERQRVALARAIVREPDVFLLDEPLSNLDAQLRVVMRAELRSLHARLGATMVHVTHDQVEALTLGDRVAVISAGRLEQVGAPDEVYRRPANRFVASFVGSPAMNFVAAELVDGRLRADGLELPAPALEPTSALPARLELGVRPEDVRIVVAADEAAMDVLAGRSGIARGRFAAEVRIVEPAGNETFVHLGVGPHRLIARGGPDLRPAPGTRVVAEVAATAIHVFDRDTGRAVR
jgi:ABC-type sugar transport system ATPase subunit